MKALLLAAGLGTRLGPLTENMPKVMVNLNGKPLLQHHIENFKKQGITEFAINTHYFPQAIKDYFQDGSKFGVKITYSFEPELLGTSGALNNFRDFFTEKFILVYADVLADFKIQPLIEVHERNKALATIALDKLRPTKGKGAVLVSGEKVTEFVEKPTEEIPDALINSGLYLLEPEILQRIPAGFSDFGHDILPPIAKEEKLYWTMHNGHLFDIGTPEILRQAQEFIKNSKQ
ncbi:MAG: NDP-sugar synthase [Nanoarchaeota archaeon]|nr:NDP-sugar synthase [Nanoarchaeota archaeon]